MKSIDSLPTSPLRALLFCFPFLLKFLVSLFFFFINIWRLLRGNARSFHKL